MSCAVINDKIQCEQARVPVLCLSVKQAAQHRHKPHNPAFSLRTHSLTAGVSVIMQAQTGSTPGTPDSSRTCLCVCADRDRKWTLPCPARCAAPKVWTPVCRLRPCSRSDTAACPGRSAGTVRTPGPSPRVRALPHTRSRDRDHRVHARVRTSWSWAMLFVKVTGGNKRQKWNLPTQTSPSRFCKVNSASFT